MDEQECTRAAVLLSVSFLLIFTSYNGIENLETSIIRGECIGCVHGSPTGICQSGDVCQDKVKYSCDDACELPFRECTSSLGSTILGVIYLTFMLSAFLGPLLPNYFGPKKSMVGGSIAYGLFAFANLAVASTPSNVSLHWWVMLPVALLLGASASVMWIAQSSYLTEVSVVYATIKHEPAVSSMGKFNGLFFAIYKSNRVTGNLISSVVLDYLAWSTTTLFMVFTCIGLCGTALLCFLPTVGAALSRDMPLHPPTRVSFKALKAMALDKSVAVFLLVNVLRMLALAPVFILNGLQQGYATSEFTSNFIRPSLGSSSIGYVMAVFGVVNVVGSYTFGKVADRVDPVTGHAVGYSALVVAYVLSIVTTVSKCDDQWALVVGIAVLLSVGDASTCGFGYSWDSVCDFMGGGLFCM
ncbi:hypothetical protein AaE_010605 [Aphanomyces astaci]|uniref:Major facilitator superfamily (MFS) profile domain-containing protein n=1 Tax=Aphanomyces astaci TaxID=112090 RepID=A0A6A4ZL48_APHAT|nr:hypothetical protein AaE_010605 [Aphanomyces astaci]